MEDVRRAVRLKARREARLQTSHSLRRKDLPKADAVPFSVHSSPSRAAVPLPPPTLQSDTSNHDSEVDFSPSIGTMPLHPVPSSANGGATLDWTGSTSEDEKSEKRWSLTLAKRKHRDKVPSSRVFVEQQDSLYADKLARIKSKVNDQTLRKAAITREQLERRYHLLLPPPNSPFPSIDPLRVARWYDQQEPGLKTSLEKAEPLTWLKHLSEKRARKTHRPSWYLTALIVEEYVKAHTSHHTMATIPENDIAPKLTPISTSFPDTMSPTSGSQWSPSPQFLEPSLSRRRSYDYQLSFEPHIDSGRDSVDAESRLSSEGFSRYWRNTLPTGSESAPSSIYHGKVNGSSSAKSSHHHLRNLAKRIRRRAYDSEEALSSSRNSISEQSPSEDDLGKSGSGSKVRSGAASPRSRRGSDDEWDNLRVETVNGAGDEPQTATTEVFKRDSAADHEGTPRPEATPEHQPAPVSPRRLIPRRRTHVSLPSSERVFAEERANRQREMAEEKEHEEYDRKARLLGDTVSQNMRTRHLLQRVAASIKDYDAVQTSLSTTLGIPYPNIPSDVLDALSHDPSAITGSTRHTESWRAVEEIYSRIHRQRRTLQAYASQLADEEGTPQSQGNIFGDPIASLKESLERLEEHRDYFSSQAERVSELLMEVKERHREVKTDYNETMAHTSLVYPELSQIVALEESYRNHYQQLWDIGLDALTLLLDTVTPFWRSYGKLIGEDVQAFLIIPWYRNEFTGESKRYPVTQLPRRSLRHWLGLLCLGVLSICVTGLQGRAAFELTLHWDLPWITHTGLWWTIFPIYIISLIIQWCAFSVELCIVAAELGVVVWWLGWAVNIFT
ncbi:hypothetical protein WOLCODRAFT_94617 [Wolfiporia cocos MD-104 SS10]|uniref:Uncharacterized protein n=1 Tax=Wolfiporia cocos (strain MD-104) TaxID=742152 RepID=A0A2H3IVI4_WOLCO|nr:hypothetical protein WOLCODRAFT_94617 [Wolfiporia cocos MD-104 SS10]